MSNDASGRGEPAGPTVPGKSITTQVRLRPPEHRLDSRAVRLWALRSFAFWGPVLAGLILAAVVASGARSWLIAIAVVVAVLGTCDIVIVSRWRYAVHRWETSDEAVYARLGWIVHEWRVAPVSRIQTVDTTRGPLERLMGLATLVVTTASSQGSIKIEGLDDDVATRAAAQLTEITQLTFGDQT